MSHQRLDPAQDVNETATPIGGWCAPGFEPVRAAFVENFWQSSRNRTLVDALYASLAATH